jgi:hypothetical protein
MTNARLILEQPCGCRAIVYEGDIVGIVYSQLARSMAEAVYRLEARGCHCPAIDHHAAR